MAVIARQNPVTPDDHGPMVAIATWFLMVAMILAVLIRVAIRFIITHAPGTEDATISVALVTIFQGISGYERRLTNLTAASWCRSNDCSIDSNRAWPWEERSIFEQCSNHGY